jgi:MFS family permease
MLENKKNTQITVQGVVIWSIAALFFLYEFFLRTFLGALAEQIIPDIHLTPSEFGLLASMFYIAYGIMQVPVGAITDKFGVKWSLISACLLCALAAFGFSQVSNFYLALVYRFLMGIGGGFAFISLLAVTLEWFPRKHLALFIGLGQFIGTMGALLAGGPLATLVVSHHVSWRIVFVGIALLGLIIMSTAFIFVKCRKTNDNEQKLVVLKPTELLTSKIKQLVSSSQAWWIATYSAFVFLAIAMLGAAWGTIYLQSLGFSQQASATIISCGWLGFACGCPLLGFTSDIFKRRKPIMLLCALLGLMLSIVFVYFPLHNMLIYCVILFVLGLTSSGQSIGFTIITEQVEPKARTIALGLNSAFITLLAAIIPYFVGLIIENIAPPVHSSPGMHYQHSDFVIAFSVIPIAYIVATLVVIFLIDETYCRPQKQIIVLSSE